MSWAFLHGVLQVSQCFYFYLAYPEPRGPATQVEIGYLGLERQKKRQRLMQRVHHQAIITAAKNTPQPTNLTGPSRFNQAMQGLTQQWQH